MAAVQTSPAENSRDCRGSESLPSCNVWGASGPAPWRPASQRSALLSRRSVHPQRLGTTEFIIIDAVIPCVSNSRRSQRYLRRIRIVGKTLSGREEYIRFRFSVRDLGIRAAEHLVVEEVEEVLPAFGFQLVAHTIRACSQRDRDVVFFQMP